MRKKFRFVCDFNVEIKEEIDEKDKERSRKLNLLLEEFLKDDRAILDLYKLWFLGDLQSDEHIEAIEQSIETKDEKSILKSVFEKLPPGEKEYFLEIIKNNNNNRFAELEKLFDRFSRLRFGKAGFVEVF